MSPEANDFFPHYDSKPLDRQSHLEVMRLNREVREHMAKVVEKSHELIYQSKSLRHRSNLLHATENFTNLLLHTCSCGRKISPTGWSKLPLVGYQTVDHLDAEMRNCECGSTITIIIERRSHGAT